MNQAPIFRDIFGQDWEKLPPVIKRHYANRPYTNDRVEVEGTIDVLCKGPIRWLGTILALMGSIPPYSENNVPVTVTFTSGQRDKKFRFCREFNFKTRKAYSFNSYMIQIAKNEVAEISAGGLGWCMSYHWNDGKVILRHKGYVLRIGSFMIKLPLEMLMGCGYADEIAVDDETFDMCMNLTHDRFGKIYEYKGRFKIISENLEKAA